MASAQISERVCQTCSNGDGPCFSSPQGYDYCQAAISTNPSHCNSTTDPSIGYRCKWSSNEPDICGRPCEKAPNMTGTVNTCREELEDKTVVCYDAITDGGLDICTSTNSVEMTHCNNCTDREDVLSIGPFRHCSQWGAEECINADKFYGFTEEEVNDLIAACPAACGTCGAVKNKERTVTTVSPFPLQLRLSGLSFITSSDPNKTKSESELNGVYTTIEDTINEGKPVYTCTTNTGLVVYMWWHDFPTVDDKWIIGAIQSQIGTSYGLAYLISATGKPPNEETPQVWEYWVLDNGFNLVTDMDAIISGELLLFVAVVVATSASTPGRRCRGPRHLLPLPSHGSAARAATAQTHRQPDACTRSHSKSTHAQSNAHAQPNVGKHARPPHQMIQLINQPINQCSCRSPSSSPATHRPDGRRLAARQVPDRSPQPIPCRFGSSPWPAALCVSGEYESGTSCASCTTSCGVGTFLEGTCSASVLASLLFQCS
jgi:hypothetical protein